jgi:hypothetical protein
MKKASIILGIIVLLGLAVVFFIQKVGGDLSKKGKEEAKWLIHDMWQATYYKTKKGNLSAPEVQYINSLMFNSRKSSTLASEISSVQCNETSPDCYLNSLARANLLIDDKKLSEGIEIATETSKTYQSSIACPIAYDLSVLKYKVITLSYKNRSEARKTADKLVSTIRQYGGLTQDLRTPSCNALADKKPEFFSFYVMLVAHLLKYGDDNSQKAAAYINARADDSLIQN